MEPTQSERPEGDPIKAGDTMAPDAQKRRGGKRRKERSRSPGSERNPERRIQPALRESNKLERGSPTDDRQPGLPRKSCSPLRIKAKSTSGSDRGPVPRHARHERSRLGNAQAKGV